MEINWTIVANAIALTALLLPGVKWLWKKYIKKPKLDIFKTGRLEVGYSLFGPTLAVRGTLLAINKEILVEKIRIEIEKIDSSNKINFDWIFFREDALSVARKMGNVEENDSTLAKPTEAFYLFPKSIRPFTIVFSNEGARTELHKSANKIERIWNEWSRQQVSNPELAGLLQQSSSPKRDQLIITLFDKFTEMPSVKRIYDDINNKLFWHAGWYNMQFIVESVRPYNKFKSNCYFYLSESNLTIFKENIKKIICATCNIPLGKWGFAYPRYETPEAFLSMQKQSRTDS